MLACAQLWQHPNLTPMYAIAAWEGQCHELLRRTRWGSVNDIVLQVLDFACDPEKLEQARRVAAEVWLPQGSDGDKVGWGFAGSDIDLFVCCKSEEEGKDLLRRTVQRIRQNVTRLHQRHGRVALSDSDSGGSDSESQGSSGTAESWSPDIRLLRSANAISVWGGWPFRTVQVCLAEPPPPVCLTSTPGLRLTARRHWGCGGGGVGGGGVPHPPPWTPPPPPPLKRLGLGPNKNFLWRLRCQLV